MQYRVLRPFRGRFGLVRAGLVLTLERSYANSLMRLPKPLVEPVMLPVAVDPIGPAVAAPAAEAGKMGESQAGGSQAGLPAAGPDKPSRSRRRGPRSRSPTLSTVAAEPD